MAPLGNVKEMSNKYKSTKVQTDGILFDSELERDTYLELKRLHEEGIIKGIVHQRPYPMRSHSGIVVGYYVADFRCLLANSAIVAVEAKGFETELWRRNKRHFLADYPKVKLLILKDRNQFPLEQTYQVFADAAATVKISQNNQSRHSA